MTSAGRALPNYRTREMLYVHSGLEKQQCSAFVQDILVIPREAQVFSICSTDAAAAAHDELLPVTTTIADQRAGGAAAAAVWICVAQQTHGPTMDKGNDAGPLLLSTPTVQQHTHVVKTQQDQQVRPTNRTTRSAPVQEMQLKINGPSEEVPHKFMPFTIRGFVSSVREADLRQTWPFTEALLRWRTQCRGDQPGILPPLHSDSNSSSSSFSSVLRSTTFFKLRTSSSIYSIPESACLRSDDDTADLVANSSIPHTAAASEEVITTRDHKSPDNFYGAAARNLKDQQQQLAAEIQTGTFLKLRGSGSSQEQVVEEEAAASGTALGKVPVRSVRRSCAAAATTVVCGKPLVAADSYSASAMRLRGHGRGSVVAATVVAGIRSSSSVAEAAASVATNRVTLLQEAPEVHEGAAAAPNLHGMEQQLVCKAEHLVGSSGNRADGIEKLRAICGDQDGGQSAGGDRHEDQRDHLTVEVNQASLQAVPVGTINNHDDDSRRDRTREEATPPGVVVDSTAARKRGLEASTAALDSGVVAEEVLPAAIVVDDQSRLVSLKHSESSGVAHGPKKSLAADHEPRSIQSPAAAAAAPHESVRIAIDKSSAQMMRSLSLQQGSSAAETTTARSAGQLAGPATVASTTVPGTSMGSGEEPGSCPVCRVFTSSSNTALNVHIDQCLVNTPSAAANSMDDNDRLHPTQSLQQAAAAHGSRAAQPKFKVKTQKKRSLAVLCAFAPRRDLEAEEESGHESGRSASRESSPAEGAASEPVQRESGIRRQPRTAFALRGAASAAAAAPKKSVRTGSTMEASTDRSLGFIGISNPGNQRRPAAAKQQHRRLSSDSAKLPNQQPGESGKPPLSDCIEQRAAESEIQTKRKRRKLPSSKQQHANSIIPAGNVCTDSKKSSTSSSEELMPGLDSQLQKNSVAGSEAAGSGHDQEVAAITSFSAEVLPISSSKRSNKVQAKLELCSSNEKVDDSLRSSSRPAKPVVKGKRNLQEPEEVNDGSQVQVAAMDVVDQLLATRPTKPSEPGAATTHELLNGKEMSGVLGMHITSGLRKFSGKKQLQAAAHPAAASGTTLVSESMSMQQQQKKAASLSSKAVSKQGEPDHKMEQQQKEQQQQKTTNGITSLKLLPARKKNKAAHGGGESLSVFQTSSMRPPPPAAGLASKTCDSPPPPPHPARKEKLKRKRPFLGYTEKEAPHLMSRSNAILREVLGLKQHFGVATNIGSCLTTNLQSELNSEAAGFKALSLQLPDIVTSSANITTATSRKRVLENVCNDDDDDDDAAAKDLLQEVDRDGADVALESPANLESQCCNTAGVLGESSEVEGQKLLGKSEQTREDHHAHQGRKSNLDIIGESQQKQEEDHHAHQGKKSNLDIIGESQEKQEEDHHAHQGKKSNLDIIGESQQTQEDCHAHQGKKNLNIIGDLQGAAHIAIMQTHEEDSSLKPAVDSSSCCHRRHMRTQEASKRKTSVKLAAGEPPPARKTIGLPARGPGGRFISTKSLKKSRDDSPNAAAVAASSNKIIALESEVLDLPAASSGVPAASISIQNSISVLDLPAASSGVPAASISIQNSISVLDLPAASSGVPAASTSIQNRISILDLPAASSGEPAGSTSIQNSISDHECPATTDHHQNSADEILQSHVVVDVVPETTISDSADGENTRFLSGGVGGSSSIEPIIEEAHDQAASDVYPLVVHQKETISPSPVCGSKSAATTDAFCKGSSSTLANTLGVIGVKAGNNNSSSSSNGNPVVVVVVPLDQQLQTSESKKLSPNSDVVEVVSEGEDDNDEDDARVTNLPRWMLSAMMEQQQQVTAQDTSQEQKHQTSTLDMQMRGQERSTVASVSPPCSCDHEQEGLIINSHGSDQDPSSIVRLFGNPVLRLMGRNVLVPKESDLNVGVMVGQKQQQFADFSQQLLLSDHENLKGQETVDTLTGVGIGTNVLESSDPADVEETINGSVPVARSLEGKPVCNDHDRALSDTATNPKVVVLWQPGDANQHVKLGGSECTLDLQLQHSWNVTASRKARGFAHNAEEWQAENSLEGGGLDHATTDLGSSSVSRPHGDQPRGIGVRTWKTKGVKSRQPPSPGAHEVIVIDDLQPLSTTDSPPEEATPLRRHDQELLAIEALMKAGALRQLPPELDEQASNLAPGARGPVMELDCSRITQLSGIHQNHDLFVELRKLGLVPTMHVNPQQSLDFTSVSLHEDLCDTIGDHHSMSNHKAIAQVPNPHRQCTATTAVTPCGLSESSCPTKASPLPAKISPSGGGGSAQHLLPPWLLAAKKQTAAQMATNLIVLDDDDDSDDVDTTVDEPPAPSRAWKRFPHGPQGGSSATCSTSTSGSCRAPRMAHAQCHSATPPLAVTARSIAAPVTKFRSLQAAGAPPSPSLLLQNSSVLRQAGGLKAASSTHGVNLGFSSPGLAGEISISGTMMPSLRSNERWNWQESPVVDIVSPGDSPACRDHLDTTSARILGRSLEAPVAFLDATHSSNSQLETLRLLDCLDFEQPMRDTGMHVATTKASTHELATTGRSSLTTAPTRWQDVPAQGTSAHDFRHHEADSSCTAPLDSCSIHIQQQPISQWHQSSTAAALSAGTSSTTLAFQSAGSFKLADQATRAPSSSSMRLTIDQAPSLPDEASSMGWSLPLHRPEANCTRALMSGNDNIVSFSNTTTIKEQIASSSGHVKQQQQQPPHLSANCSNASMIPDLMTMTPLGKQVARNAFYREQQLLLPLDSSSAQPNAAASMKTGGNFNSGICQTNV